MKYNNIESNIWKYYIFSFLDMFCLFLPFIVYYFQELGFNLVQIAVINSATIIVIIIFEIPSGYIADRIGRKNSLIISVGLQAVSMVILFYSNTYLFLIIAHVVLGVAITFLSGADSAFLYDTLLELKLQSKFKKYDGMAKAISEIAIILSALLGALFIKYAILNIQGLILYTAIGHFLLFLFSFSLIEPHKHKPQRERDINYFLDLLHIISNSVKNRKLLGLFIYSFVVLGFSNTIFLYYQPYFAEVNIPVAYFGVIIAFFSIFTAIASVYAYTIEKKIGIYWSLLIMPIFIILSYLFTSIFFVWYGILFFIFRELIRGYVFPVLGDYTNKLIESDIRATVLSIGNIFSRLGLVFISILIGFFSDNYSIRASYFIASIILSIITVFFVFYFRFRNNSNVF